MNDIMTDFLDDQRLLALERAADEYIQAENDIVTEAVTLGDKFVDLSLKQELDGMSEEDLNSELDSEAELLDDEDDYTEDGEPVYEDELDDNEYDDTMPIDADIEALVDELDLEDGEDF